MKVNKFNKTLRKLNALVDSIDGTDSEISKLEKGLMRKYLIDMFEYLSSGEEKVLNDIPTTTNPREKTQNIELRTPKQEEKKSIPNGAVEVDRSYSNKQEIELKTVPSYKENPIKEKETLIAESIKESKPRKESLVEKVAPTTSNKTNRVPSQINPAHYEIFEEGDGNELSDRLGEMPIQDLTKSMGINERILTVNNLFGGDNGIFKNTINHLNGLGSFEEAKAYISSNLVNTYDWMDPSRIKKAKLFIKLIKRRYK